MNMSDRFKSFNQRIVRDVYTGSFVLVFHRITHQLQRGSGEKLGRGKGADMQDERWKKGKGEEALSYT